MADVDPGGFRSRLRRADTDRAGLERLARYILRPIISADRLTLDPDGRVEYRFRKPDPTGRTSWVTDGSTWCRRIATLIPPRRSHTTRFHGIFASAHRLSGLVVPTPACVTDPGERHPRTAMTLARRLDWAQLLRRAWRPDVATCPTCDDTLRVLAFITHPTSSFPSSSTLDSPPPCLRSPRLGRHPTLASSSRSPDL